MIAFAPAAINRYLRSPPAILAVMRTVPRHEFVRAEVRRYAYMDRALPIGDHQTISPPFVAAWMTQKLDPHPTDSVLEIGTGSDLAARR